jgi:glyoxylase-like metal-dependent hydrolase (beta-lactamase superfamily II)
MRKTWALVVAFIATAATGAEWSYVPEGRGALEVPDAVWERALMEAGLAGRAMGYTADEMANYGRAPHCLSAVESLFRDIRLVPRFTGRVGDGFIARLDDPAGAVWYAYRLLGISAARGVNVPAPGTFGVDWIPDGADAGTALDAVLAHGKPGDPICLLAGEDREKWTALPEPLKRLALHALVGAVEAAPILREAFDGEFLARALGGAEPTPAALYALATQPFSSEAPSRASLEALDRVDLAYLALGSVVLLRHVEAGLTGIRAAGEIDFSGVTTLCIPTPAGPLAILGPGDDEAPEGCAVLIDTGGNDHYRGRHAVPLSLDRPAGLVIDLAGDDRYEAGDGKGTMACGNHGVGALFDLAGNDRYSAGESGLACAWFGTGLLVDHSGDDLYSGGKWVTGAAHAGVALLLDGAGRDRYECRTEAQGFGGTLGAGVLLDAAGNDEYVADLQGNVEEIFRGQSVSFAQGAGFGRRADFGDGHSLAGGIGLLVEGSGDDAYLGGVYCQGAGYWWSLGALEDRAGNDRYSSVQYSLGSAPHMAVGSCVDLSGNDTFNIDTADLYMQSVGCARDGSLAVFIDGAGDDQYRVGNRSAGSGEVNAFGFFWDRSGDDTYVTERATPSPSTPAFGCVGVERAEAGSFRAVMPSAGFFLDTGGHDTFAERRPDGLEGPPVLAAEGSSWHHSSTPRQSSFGHDTDLYRPEPRPVYEDGAILAHRFETTCNTYFVTCRKTGRFVVVDPVAGILPEVRAFVSGGHEIAGAWLTHEHGDHLTGLAELVAAFPVPVFAHPETTLAMPGVREHWTDGWGAPGTVPPMPDRLVRDGDEVAVGAAKAVAIHVPGHSRGSICFRFGDGLLLSGDVLFRGSIGRTDLDTGDDALFGQSLSGKVFDLPEEMTVLPGHMGETTIGAEKRDNWPFVDHVRAARGEPPIPRPWMGVRLDQEFEGPGLRVEEVPAGTPAEAAGVLAGDVLKRFGEIDLGGYEDLATLLRGVKPGDRAPLVVLRDGIEVTIDFRFGERPR